MSDRRRLYHDLTALTLLLTGLTVALAVFGQAPDGSANLLGDLGAAVAASLLDGLGIAVYPLFAAWFVLVVLLFQRRGMLRWSLRLAGWLALSFGSALAGHMLAPPGTGGSLGEELHACLQVNFRPLGCYLVLAGCLLLGVGLALDFALAWVSGALRWLTGPVAQLVASSFGSIAGAARRVRPRKVPSRSPRPARTESMPAGAIVPIHHAGTPPTDEEEAAPAREDYADYELPPLNLLQDGQPTAQQEHEQVLRERAALLEKTFADFNLKVRVVGIHTGPVVTQYEVALETGLRVAKVTSLADDLALNLKVPNVRIVAPIPGKNTVGIEIPNAHRAMVRLKEVMRKPTDGRQWASKMKLPLFLGKDTEGKPLVYDLAEMPHLLIAGRTGTGKSVCMNTLILSLLMTRRPDEVKMIMIDPKRLELSEYAKVPHLMHPVVTDMKKAEAILAWAVDKMEERYDILSRARVRNVAGYNELAPEEILRRVKPADEEERQRVPDRMPYIILFIDELADLMMQMKKEVEGHIIRLAQKSRAAGIHLVVATQKPTVDVITGLIKSNLPARICFQVSSRTDSSVVLDEKGAERLLGKGDLLFLQPGTSTVVRAQGCYAANEEIEAVVSHLECDEPAYAEELMQLHTLNRGKGGLHESLRERDELYEQAIEVVVREGRGSTSLLQRALGIGYGRASRLIDFMAEDGIVGPYNGSSAREVLCKPEEWEQLKNGGKLAETA